MKYFTREWMFSNSSIDGSKAESLYQENLSKLLKTADKSLSKFVDDLKNVRPIIGMHDASVRGVEITGKCMKIKTSCGVISIKDVHAIEIQLGSAGNDVWLREELLSVEGNSRQRHKIREYFTFNVLLEDGQISCIAKDIRLEK